jgi:hypothetical protein
VWTVLGVGAFVFMILMRDPGQLQDLPKIPEQFLYLMGISAAGYLGGKLARKPGPIIEEITAGADGPTLEIRGRNLSMDASFKLDDRDLARSMLEPLKPESPNSLLIPGEREEQPDFVKSLTLKIKESALTTSGKLDWSSWLKSSHQFAIINPDGQKATWIYPQNANGQTLFSAGRTQNKEQAG